MSCCHRQHAAIVPPLSPTGASAVPPCANYTERNWYVPSKCARQSQSFRSSRLPHLGTMSDTVLTLPSCRAHDFWIAPTEFVDSGADAGSTSCPAPGERSRKNTQSKANGQEHPGGCRGVYYWGWRTTVQRATRAGAPSRFHDDEKEAGYPRFRQSKCQGT